jgi:hypothetical protein
MEIYGKDWRELCTAAAEEPDPGKLISLVHQILEVFEERERRSALPEQLET